MADKARLSVLLDDPSQLHDKLLVIARVVANVLEEHPTDVAQRVRYGGGIVARDVAEPYAREITRGLAVLGLGSFLVEQLVAAPRPRRIGGLEVHPDGLIITQRLKPSETFDWSQVQALHAHALLEPKEEGDDAGHSRRGGDLTRIGDAAKRVLNDVRELEEKQRARITLGLDIILDGPLCYRLSSDEPGIYASLPERSTIALENYLALVALLAKTAPAKVKVSKLTRRFVEAHDVGLVLFSKREELDAFTTWTLHALAAGIEQGAEPEDLADEGLEDETAAPGAAKEAEEDEADEEDDDEDEEGDDDALDHSADGLEDEDLADVAVDAEVKAQAALFDKTGRFQLSDVKAIVAEQQDLSGAVDSADPDVDPEVKAVAGMFDASSGRWDVRKVMEGGELTAKDLEAKNGGEPPPPS
jgi:hypothetical protein